MTFHSGQPHQPIAASLPGMRMSAAPVGQASCERTVVARIREFTVKKHMKGIFSKLDIAHCAQAARFTRMTAYARSCTVAPRRSPAAPAVRCGGDRVGEKPAAARPGGYPRAPGHRPVLVAVGLD